MFGKPKKLAVGKADSEKQYDKVRRRLRKKYPQMHDKAGNFKEKYMGRKLTDTEKALRASGSGPSDMKTDEEKRAWRKNR